MIITRMNIALTAPMLMNMRTPSTSAVARDMSDPVACLSWNAKLKR